MHMHGIYNRPLNKNASHINFCREVVLHVLVMKYPPRKGPLKGHFSMHQIKPCFPYRIEPPRIPSYITKDKMAVPKVSFIQRLTKGWSTDLAH